MQPVLFYGVPQGCSFGSIVALEWLGQPYQLCRIEMLEQPWDRLFGRINPLYQTPALLLESGEALSESLAILLHLAARAPDTPLAPRQGSPAFDQLNQMLSYLVTDFFSAFVPLWVAYEKPELNDEARSVLRALGQEKVADACAYLDQLLSDRPWLLGERRSLADAYLAGVARWVEYHQLFDPHRDYPHLARYLARLAADPAVRFATALEQGEAADGSAGFMGHVSLEQLRPRLVGE
ncbi:glutathione S-transferase family protein [Pseudomonas lalucatii]|uniref:Glutathione S-transferase family protein n=1 Tax=Pseudomonas lalucatii TaxID=1424203 RepID=A0ABS5PZB5_9PSED|nr:glutathione S-transferase family protein [Pseudomonas lalucatii]MBS7661845.1 glutathione S-transferase family protein [Pseudomonas lalucatii]MBS7690606.1 glutathione S-transferase family protein [Pseudomonas lalucatii]QVM88178.1 glutathione S-transferase family protein [Pseudomonas lalucatii]